MTSSLFIQPDKDPFGCDPFAVLHAPTRDGAPPGRPTSPSPALPPKKSKQPPPRPAPPRPAQPSSKPDPFAAPTNDPFGSGGFANFADFDSKVKHSIDSELIYFSFSVLAICQHLFVCYTLFIFLEFIWLIIILFYFRCSNVFRFIFSVNIFSYQAICFYAGYFSTSVQVYNFVSQYGLFFPVHTIFPLHYYSNYTSFHFEYALEENNGF